MPKRPLYSKLLHSLSIRAQLILITTLLLCGIACYALYEQYSFAKLDQLQQASLENQNSEIDLLTLRRHEKDFLARQDLKYVDRFDKTITILKERIVRIQSLLNGQASRIQGSVTLTLDTLSLYQSQFNQLAKKLQDQGSKSETGLTLEVISARTQLAEEINLLGDFELQAAYTLLLNQSTR
ncbi:methyl-accepting chemotaxis protein, partial [Vibrio makurazakiensis]